MVFYTSNLRTGKFIQHLVGLCLASLTVVSCKTQQPSSQANSTPSKPGTSQVSSSIIGPKYAPYQPERTRVFDLVHTKLELEPIWEKKHLKGLATLTLTPHFGQKQSLELDAKGFDIQSVKRITATGAVVLKTTYDGMKLKIELDSAFSAGKLVKVEISYTAKPEESNAQTGLKAIESDKGLYFINASGKLPNRPRELWTQGETESSSRWFPTIDAPNQKSTQEIHLTVDTAFTTLSNGLLTQQVKLGAKRKDIWELKQPHAPYLFMIAVGPFAIVKDKWRDMEVSYYVEKPYKNRAKAVFGNTPEMIEFISKRLGVNYPWPKYSQIVGRDYVSGAMENTSATLFLEEILQEEPNLRDENWDDIIVHELFHQWFGDLTTCESWSNLSLNESFANYAQLLWKEHKGGKDEVDFENLNEKSQYLYESRFKQEPLIRFRYNKELEMFDGHSYAKGGRILHMLRNHLGDDAFFAGLQAYLTKFAYKKAEAHDLRLVFEEVSGQDLNWFFDQWYFKPGHPELKVRKTFTGESLLVSVSQIQDTTYTPIYRLPITIDTWQGDKRSRHTFTLTERDGTFEIPMGKAPSLMQIDPDHVLLAEFVYERTLEEYLHAFDHAPRARDRVFALEQLVKGEEKFEVNEHIRKALKDPSHYVRLMALELCNNNSEIDAQTRKMIADLAITDKNVSVRADAAGLIGNQKIEPVVQRLSEILDKEPAYSVQAEALNQYVIFNGPDIEGRMKKLENSPSPVVIKVLAELYATRAGKDNFNWFKTRLHDINKDVQFFIIRGLGVYAADTKGPARAEAIALLETLVQYQAESPNITAGLAAAVKVMDQEDPATATLAAKLLVKK